MKVDAEHIQAAYFHRHICNGRAPVEAIMAISPAREHCHIAPFVNIYSSATEKRQRQEHDGWRVSVNWQSSHH